tara:strand:- start:1981 stop:2868 length:888 start_codon:yes stop_codon:yes gene_type:complete
LTKNLLYLWASDYAENSGEGKLARLFTKYLIKNDKYKIKLNQNITYYRYLSPFFGILYCWKYYLKKKRVAYINYLPLWNFFIFMLLPPKTILGPITGGAKYSYSNEISFFIRKLLFPLFYKISEYFLLLRSTEVFFSTDLLKQNLSNKLKHKSKFNFLINNMNFKKLNNQNKDIDFLLYYRKHKNKESFFPHQFIKKITLSGFKIDVIGDKLNIKNIKNHGYLKNKDVQKLQSRTKFTIASGENIYSIFTVECLTNGVKILIDKKYYNQAKFLKKEFIITNFKENKNVLKLKKIK